MVFVGFLRQSCCFVLIYALFYTKYRFLLSLISSVFHFLYWLCSLLVFNFKIRSWFSFFLRVCFGFEKNSIFVLFYEIPSVHGFSLFLSCFRCSVSLSFIFNYALKILFLQSFFLQCEVFFFLFFFNCCIMWKCDMYKFLCFGRNRYRSCALQMLSKFCSLALYLLSVSFLFTIFCLGFFYSFKALLVGFVSLFFFLFIRYYLFGFWEIHEKQMNESRRMGKKSYKLKYVWFGYAISEQLKESCDSRKQLWYWNSCGFSWYESETFNNISIIKKAKHTCAWFSFM